MSKNTITSRFGAPFVVKQMPNLETAVLVTFVLLRNQYKTKSWKYVSHPYSEKLQNYCTANQFWQFSSK